MPTMSTQASVWVKSFIVTSIICFAIAIATQTIWNSALVDHLLISFGFGYSAVFSSFIVSFYPKSLSSRQTVLIPLTVSMIFGTLNAYYWLSRYHTYSNATDLKPIVFLGFLFTTACFFYFRSQEQKVLAQKELEIAKRKQSEQEKALILSQLKQLQSQIEPHFLFNTLANINVLIEKDAANARLMLESLTELLRGTLKSSRNPLNPLQDELDHANAYLSIQKIRLGDRLHYTIANSLDGPIHLPPLLLQPLVENAIQHGIEPLNEGGEVEINVCQLEQNLVIEVVDNGIGLGIASSHIGHGVGLDNTRQRLAALFGQDASLIISEMASGGVKAQIRIAQTSLQGLMGSEQPMTETEKGHNNEGY